MTSAHRYSLFQPRRLTKAALWASHFLTNLKECAGVIVIHGIHTAEMAHAYRAPSRSIPVHSFRESIAALQSVYSIVRLEEIVRMLSGLDPWRENCIALTFDDSLSSMAKVAAPALKELGATATFFLSTKAIDRRVGYWWDEIDARNEFPAKIRVHGDLVQLPDSDRAECAKIIKAKLRGCLPFEVDEVLEQLEAHSPLPRLANPHAEIMNWDDARDLLALGMDIGSHTVSHPNLARLEEDSLISELAASKHRIEEETGRPCSLLAYPYGAYNQNTALAARKVGYAAAVTTEPRWNKRGVNPHTVSRRHLPKDSVRLVKMFLRGPSPSK